MGRAGEVGDELGSRVVAARLVREVMQLCFLMERQYAPYSKWFGSAFARLTIAPQLMPHLHGALTGETWKVRDHAFATIYRLVLEQHNALRVTAPLDPTPVLFHTRPFTVLPPDRLWRLLCDAITDPRVRRLTRNQHQVIGAISQWADSTDVLDSPPWWERLRRAYQDEAAGEP